MFVAEYTFDDEFQKANIQHPKFHGRVLFVVGNRENYQKKFYSTKLEILKCFESSRKGKRESVPLIAAMALDDIVVWLVSFSWVLWAGILSRIVELVPEVAERL